MHTRYYGSVLNHNRENIHYGNIHVAFTETVYASLFILSVFFTVGFHINLGEKNWHVLGLDSSVRTAFNYKRVNLILAFNVKIVCIPLFIDVAFALLCKVCIYCVLLCCIVPRIVSVPCSP